MIRVAIVHSAETLRLGIVAALVERGFDARSEHRDRRPPSQISSIAQSSKSIVLYEHRPGLSPPAIDRCHESLVAFADTGDARAIRTALSDGAISVVDAASNVDELRSVLEAASTGMARVRPEVLRLLADDREKGSDCALTKEQLGYLRDLADGVTILELAERWSRSERDMYRVLSAMWERLGVKDRTEALVLAAQSGWLETHREAS